MSLAVRIVAGVVVLLVIAAGGLAIYGSQVTPARHTSTQVLPDGRFPN